MKKLFIVIALLLTVLAGCSTGTTPTKTPTTNKVLTVLAPKGAPAIGVLGYARKNAAQVTTVDGADLLQAALVNPNSEYDVVVAPVNLGAKLISAGKSDYKLAAIITWGNLYIISTDTELKADAPMATFGQGAVPEKVFETVKSSLGYTGEVTYFSAVSEVAGQLIAGKYTTGLVAEPVMSEVIAAGKARGVTLYEVSSLQDAWKETTGNDNYPQAAIFVKQADYDANTKSYTNLFSTLRNYTVKATADDVVTDMTNLAANDATMDLIGVDAKLISSSTLANLNIKYTPAADAKAEVLAFVKLFGVESLDNVLLTVK